MKKKHRKPLYTKIIYLLAITCLVTGLSMAKYQSIYDSSGVALIASWSIKVNDDDITEGTTLEQQITLVPQQSTNVVNGKLAPGYGGYFDIEIDPTGTEVSFDYIITLDVTQLPTDVEIVGYTMGTEGTAETATPITNNQITNSVTLGDSAFNEQNVQNIRVYWMWNDVTDNNSVHTAEAISNAEYKVGVNVTVTQKIDG